MILHYCVKQNTPEAILAYPLCANSCFQSGCFNQYSHFQRSVVIHSADFSISSLSHGKGLDFYIVSSLVKTFRNYLLIAVDGTTLNFPSGRLSLQRFGFDQNKYVKTAADAKKATSRSSALYDVTNGIILDFVMRHYKDSEIPIAIEQLDRIIQYIRGRAAIFLADRYYDSVEVFSILEGYGMKYCIRGKANFFKHYVEKMKSNDEWIDVCIDKTWQKRLKYDQPRQRFEKDPWIMIRVVKYRYTYFTEKGSQVTADLIYFTNLSCYIATGMMIFELVQTARKRKTVMCRPHTICIS